MRDNGCSRPCASDLYRCIPAQKSRDDLVAALLKVGRLYCQDTAFVDSTFSIGTFGQQEYTSNH